MTSPTMRRSTPKLSEIARKVAAPKGAVSTGWPAVRKTCREKLGVSFDPWQDQVGSLILAKRADGSLASTVDGVGMSLPRQVGKTYLIASLTFALCVNMPGLLVIWTAHHMGTAGETFLALQGFAERSKVKPHVRQVFTGSGDEEVRFHNGSRILFGARERGFGRGIPGVDILIFDEAQILSDKAMSNMLATMNTSRFGLHLYVGTPPKPEDMSETFTRMRDQAFKGTLHDGAWVEFGADPKSDPDDRAQWAKANPSYPHRTPAQSVLRLRRKLTEGDFLREGLGIWDEMVLDPSVITRDQWTALSVPEPPAEGVDSYGVKFSPDGAMVALCAARKTEDGVIHLELIERRSMGGGTGWLVEWLAGGESPRWRKAAQIVVDGKAHAGNLVNALRSAGVPARVVVTPTTDQVTAAHSMLVDAVKAKTITVLAHPGQATLVDSVAASARREIGKTGGWGFRPIGDGECTSAESAVMAHWGAKTSKRRPGRKQRVVVG